MVIATLTLVVQSATKTARKIDSIQDNPEIEQFFSEPIITRSFNANRTTEEVYYDSLKWLSYIGARIKNKYPPTGLSASHGSNPFEVDSNNDFIPRRYWLKTIDIKISSQGKETYVTIVMDSGLKKFHNESFERRKKEWQKLVDEYMLFIDANMSQITKNHLIQNMRVNMVKQSIGGIILLIIVNYFVYTSGEIFKPEIRFLLYVFQIYLIWRLLLRFRIRFQILKKQSRL